MRAFATLVAGLLAITGCTGGQTQCGVISFALPAPPSMISPAPGTTGLPTSGVTVEITYQPSNATLRVVAQDTGATLFGAPFTAATPPPGSTPPPSFGPVVSALPALAPHTTYDVFVDAVFPPAPKCTSGGNSGPASYRVGTLSTQ